MKQLLILATLLLVLFIHPVSAQRLAQPFDRGVVAVYRSGGRSVTSAGGTGSLISWRKLAQEPEGTTYNVYKRAQGATEFTKMNATPLKVTNYKPASLTTNTEYAVTAITDALSAPIASNSLVDVYTTDGICLFLRRPYSEVRSTLRPGTYVLVFGNTSRKIIVKNLAQFRE